MKILKTIVVAAIAIVFSACGEKKTSLGDYPLDTCVVAGKKLGSMGEPFLHVHEGQKVYFCCGGCKETFDEDPKKYLAKIEAAKAARKAAGK
jgi:YHS domain-containing protein